MSTARSVLALTHPPATRWHANTRTWTSPSSITANSISLPSGAVDITCHMSLPFWRGGHIATMIWIMVFTVALVARAILGGRTALMACARKQGQMPSGPSNMNSAGTRPELSPDLSA